MSGDQPLSAPARTFFCVPACSRLYIARFRFCLLYVPGPTRLPMSDLCPPVPLPWLPEPVVSRVVFPRPACRSSRPCPVLRRRRPRVLLPSSPFWTEIDRVWISLFPPAPPRLPAPTSASADRHRARAFPPGHSSSPSTGSAPGPPPCFHDDFFIIGHAPVPCVARVCRNSVVNNYEKSRFEYRMRHETWPG